MIAYMTVEVEGRRFASRFPNRHPAYLQLWGPGKELRGRDVTGKESQEVTQTVLPTCLVQSAKSGCKLMVDNL
jgi:hypothetical protein